MTYRVSVLTDHAGALILLSGDLDLDCVADIAATVAQAAQTPSPSVTIELSEVAFADASFLGALVSAHHVVRAAGGSLTIAHPSRAVTGLLRLSGLDTSFSTTSS